MAMGSIEGSGKLPFSKILVTGADGFVGRYLTPALRDRRGPKTRLYLTTGLELAVGPGPTLPFNLAEPDTVARAIEAVQPDLIVHLAGQASVGLAETAAAQTWSVNLAGSLAIARAVQRVSPHCAFLFVSSAEVYGSSLNAGRATEQTPLAPTST
jgi:GDP-4-dehydro-6-deoxy-D-mannose reductase